jgi:hypothetical protein
MSAEQKDKAKAIVSFVLLGVQVAGLFGAPVALYFEIINQNQTLIAQLVSAGIGTVQAFLPAVQDKK